MSRNAPSARAVVEDVYDAVEAGDLDRVVAALDASVEWIEPEGGPYGGTYVGPEAVVENVFAELGGEWETFAVDPNRFVVDGGTVVALVTHRGTRESGEDVEAPIADVWDVEDGKVTRFQHFVGSVSYVLDRRGD